MKRPSFPAASVNRERVKCVDISHDESRCVVGFGDGSVSVYDIVAGVENIVEAFSSSPVCVVQWHKSNSVVCVCYEDGEIYLFDRAMQPIKILLQNNLTFGENLPPFRHISISSLLGHKTRIHHLTWGSNGVTGCLGGTTTTTASQQKIECAAVDTVAVAVDRGPVVIIRIELGAWTQGKISNSVIINNRLALRQFKEAIELLSTLSSAREFHSCFVNLVTYLFDVSANLDTNEYLRLAFDKCWPIFAGAPGNHLDHATNLYIRYFYNLLGGLKLEEAYRAAVIINKPELFKEIIMYCRDEPIILDAALDKLQSSYGIDVARRGKRVQQLEQAMNELRLDDSDDVLLEGLFLESEGKLKEAQLLYSENRKEKELRRLISVTKIFKSGGNNTSTTPKKIK